MKSVLTYVATFMVFIANTKYTDGSFLLSIRNSNNLSNNFRLHGEYVGQPEDDLTCDPTINWEHHIDTVVDGLHGEKYAPGKADTDFARRYGYLAGKEIKTVSESFHDFYQFLGHPILSYYKTMVADLVETTHLALYNARFKMDPIWSLGLLYNLDELLKNYPDKVIAQDIKKSLFITFKLNEDKIRSEAKLVEDIVQRHNSTDEINSMFRGEGVSLISEISKIAKGDKYWMYHRFFGFGLIKILSMLGLEPSDENEPIIEAWVVEGIGKKDLSSAVYSDCREWNKRSEKINIMSQLLAELEIREKKKKAKRLEEKAQALTNKARKSKHFSEFNGISHHIN